MNVETYRERKRQLLAEEPQHRELCTTCMQPKYGCYCASVRRFDPKMRFIILIHPIEVKRRIATGRMSHLSLENSRLIPGRDYSGNRHVDEIVNNPAIHSVMLYPGKTAANLTPMSSEARAELFPNGKELAIFVIDGTWATARQMVRSENLKALPRVCFSPETPSTFRVRKQPAPGCYSTIEAIHHTIELLGDARGFDTSTRQHDALLDVFDVMVQRQLQFVRDVRSNRQLNYRREKLASTAPAKTTHHSVGK